MQDWFKKITSLERTRLDDESEYLHDALDSAVDYDEDFKSSTLSSLWYRGREKTEDAQRIVLDMLRIRDTVHNFIKVHGIPVDTEVSIAAMGDGGLGACTFKDLKNHKKPRIILDKSIYDNCDSHEMMDVYCGIALHEASHANHTKMLFDALRTKKLVGVEKLFAGLLEDERIESLARKESPGFAPYLQAVKRVIFEKEEFGSALDQWEEAPDLDRLTILIFGYIRCPYLITNLHTSFKLIDESTPWNDLKNIISTFPDTESKVLWTSKKLKAYYDSKAKLYEKETSKEGSESSSSEASSKDAGDCKSGKGSKSDTPSAIKVQQQATEDDVQDAIEASSLNHKREQLDSETSYDHDKDKHAKTTGKDLVADGESKKKYALKRETEKEKLSEKMDDLKEKRKGRFSLQDLKRMMDRVDVISNELSVEESIELEKVEKDRISEYSKWDHSEGTDEGERRTVVSHPAATPESSQKYQNYLNLVKDEIARMRNIFRFRLGSRIHRQTEKKSGKLHRRRLARCNSTERLFYKKQKIESQGLSICLLLDESGSMGEARVYPRSAVSAHRYDRAETALSVAILIAESLKNVPGIELEVYSYGSTGVGNVDNYVKYLYGKNNPNLNSIARYGHGYQNYDHVAIETASSLMLRNTSNENRLMIILSDGLPCGTNYGGEEARRKTKRSALEAETKYGIEILHIAIANFDAKDLFKNTLSFTNLKSLTRDMRRLVTGIIRKITV